MIKPKYPGTFTITTQPYLEICNYNQSYKNILIINMVPEGPLKDLVRMINLPSLSPFQREDQNSYKKCGLALTSLLNYSGSNKLNFNSCGNSLMTPNEIPDLYSFLTANGYQIDTQLTNMMNGSEVNLSNSRNVCSATYFGDNQPNIMYIK
jgi:hypothetical protein